MLSVLVYIDESFNEKEFWVTGLVVPDAAAVALERDLDEVVSEAASHYSLPHTAELHGHDLMHATKEWAPLKQMFRARYGVLTDALRAIAGTPGIRAFSRGLNRAGLKLRYSNPHEPREILIGFVAQECHKLLKNGQVLALFVDDNPTKDGIRDHVRDFKKHGTWDRFNGEPLKNILDTVYFAPSCDSRLLQAADLVSYAHYRARTTPESARSYDAAQEAWELVRPFCDVKFWQP